MKEIKMEIKKHFKLYKSGKQWVTAAVATVAVSTALLYGGVAHANQQVQQASTTQDQTSTVNNDIDKTVALDTNTDQSAQTTDKKQVVSNTNQSKTDDTSTADKNSTSIPVSVLPSNNTEKQAKNYNEQDKGNYGNIDTAYFSNNQLHVSGWNATNASQGTNSRQIIVRDITTNNELGRTDVTNNVARPDVKNVHNVYNADNSGFDVNVNIDFSKMKDYRDSIEI
ncbi:KxYKxGKxW signal peptide domain-containing protein, partial [Limosilactobacillus reuteri]|nr:KxYKxGKxW signal peptide domain-containing protein [Limosilactobacillus reuteri]